MAELCLVEVERLGEMNETIVCRPLRDDEVEAASTLACQAFDQFVAPAYTQEGRDAFHAYASVAALRQRHREDHRTFVAEDSDGRLIGMLHLREGRHVAMLFVDPPRQRQGVGRRLLALAREQARAVAPMTRVLTVNSSPNAVAAYERLGFAPLGPEQTVHGIRFVSMEWPIDG